jgi:hypothetical protein
MILEGQGLVCAPRKPVCSGALGEAARRYFDSEPPPNFGYWVSAFGRKGRIEPLAFWILIVAWICANNPQAAVVATMSWIQEAHRRSSHQNLNLTVAELLGESTNTPVQNVESHGTDQGGKPLVLPQFHPKKIELASEPTPGGPVPQTSAFLARLIAKLKADSRNYPPLLGPPRAG